MGSNGALQVRGAPRRAFSGSPSVSLGAPGASVASRTAAWATGSLRPAGGAHRGAERIPRFCADGYGTLQVKGALLSGDLRAGSMEPHQEASAGSG
jgi:hypothetical protein